MEWSVCKGRTVKIELLKVLDEDGILILSDEFTVGVARGLRESFTNSEQHFEQAGEVAALLGKDARVTL